MLKLLKVSAYIYRQYLSQFPNNLHIITNVMASCAIHTKTVQITSILPPVTFFVFSASHIEETGTLEEMYIIISH